MELQILWSAFASLLAVVVIALFTTAVVHLSHRGSTCSAGPSQVFWTSFILSHPGNLEVTEVDFFSCPELEQHFYITNLSSCILIFWKLIPSEN